MSTLPYTPNRHQTPQEAAELAVVWAREQRALAVASHEALTAKAVEQRAAIEANLASSQATLDRWDREIAEREQMVVAVAAEPAIPGGSSAGAGAQAFDATIITTED